MQKLNQIRKTSVKGIKRSCQNSRLVKKLVCACWNKRSSCCRWMENQAKVLYGSSCKTFFRDEGVGVSLSTNTGELCALNLRGSTSRWKLLVCFKNRKKKTIQFAQKKKRKESSKMECKDCLWNYKRGNSSSTAFEMMKLLHKPLRGFSEWCKKELWSVLMTSTPGLMQMYTGARFQLTSSKQWSYPSLFRRTKILNL